MGVFDDTTVTLKTSAGMPLAADLPVQIDTVNIPWNMEAQGLIATDWYDLYSIGWTTPVPQRGQYLVDEATGTKYSVFGKAAVYFDHLEIRCSVPSGATP